MIVVYGYSATSHCLGVALHSGCGSCVVDVDSQGTLFSHWGCNFRAELISSFLLYELQSQISNFELSSVCFKWWWCTATTQPTILSELLCILGAEGCVVDVSPQGTFKHGGCNHRAQLTSVSFYMKSKLQFRIRAIICLF